MPRRVLLKRVNAGVAGPRAELTRRTVSLFTWQSEGPRTLLAESRTKRRDRCRASFSVCIVPCTAQHSLAPSADEGVKIANLPGD